MLSDGTIRLDPLGEEHLAGLAALGRDPIVRQNTRLPDPWIEGFERQWLSRYEEGRRDGTREGFAIVDVASGDFLGLAALVTIEVEERQGEIGYIVSSEARGRGVASRALALVTAHALGARRLERVELLISTDNDASLRVADRSGYRREGVLRSLYIKPGMRSDTVVYSRLPTD